MSKAGKAASGGQPQHSVKIRIRGERQGTASYNALVDHYRGPIAQLLRAAQQQVQLSGNGQYKTKVNWGDAEASYHNNNGQETVYLAVHPTGGGEEVSESSEAYWEWAIIELDIPALPGFNYARISAFMEPKPATKEGVARDDYPPFEDNPPLAFPHNSIATYMADVSIDGQVASLRVDLTQYPRGIKFDLYGYIDITVTYGPEEGPVEGSLFAAGRRAVGVSPNTATWTTASGLTLTNKPAPVDISGRTFETHRRNTVPAADIEEDFPELLGASFSSVSISSLNFLYDTGYGGSVPPDQIYGPGYSGGLTTIWTPGSGNMPTAASVNAAGLVSAAGGSFTETITCWDAGETIIKKVRGLGAVTYYTTSSGGVTTYHDLSGGGPVDAYGNWSILFYDYTKYWIGERNLIEHINDEGVDVPVRFAVFDGEPDAYSYQNGPSWSSLQWEREKTYPERWVFKELPDQAHITAIDDPVDTSQGNKFGHVRIGQIKINPRKGKGGIKFTPA